MTHSLPPQPFPLPGRLRRWFDTPLRFNPHTAMAEALLLLKRIEPAAPNRRRFVAEIRDSLAWLRRQLQRAGSTDPLLNVLEGLTPNDDPNGLSLAPAMVGQLDALATTLRTYAEGLDRTVGTGPFCADDTPWLAVVPQVAPDRFRRWAETLATLPADEIATRLTSSLEEAERLVRQLPKTGEDFARLRALATGIEMLHGHIGNNGTI